MDALAQRVLIYDGAMGTSIQKLDLSSIDFGGKDGCNDYLALTRPDVIAGVHRAFMEVGCDVLETNTFGANRLKMEEYGLGDLTRTLNVTAARLARSVADEFSTPDHPRFVAGSMGPTGMLPSSSDAALGAITYQQLAQIFAEQAAALIEGGCDVLLIETTQDILELKAAIAGCRRACIAAGTWVPIQAQVTLDTSGRMLLGTDIAAAMTILEALPVDVIGLNCSTGPEHMREPVRFLSERCQRPISVIPNAGLPLNEGGHAVYPLEPEPMARALSEFVNDMGVNIVGGCCGTTPEHLRAVVAAIGQRPPLVRKPPVVPMLASAIRSTVQRQEPAPTLVGERVNTLGSRRAKRLLLQGDYDSVVQIARGQVEDGAHALDVCVAMTERTDEADMMRTLVKQLQMSIEAPLVIDSTEADVIRAALESYPGRALINSVNMENGRVKIDATLPIIREHGAAVIAMTIDEQGMAKTAERKLEVAERIFRIATEEYGLPPSAVVFDTQVFPLSTGQEDLLDSAVQTLQGIRRIKDRLPGAMTILGISNVSFGLAEQSRAVLNSVFLHHAVEAGLDMAIVNPKDVVPYGEIPSEQRDITDDLVNNRRPDALARFIEYFNQNSAVSREETALNPMEGMAAEQKIHYQILHRLKDGIEIQIDEALTRHTPVEVLNGVLLPAMKEVGDRFGAGELILPFVLQSAEVMKRSVAYLEQFLERKEGYTKGKVVLATVFGDVHDIGKNLVNTILSNNGYTVYDLGKQVPINRIIDTAIEVNADAIGLSALLVSTSKQMPLCVQELHRRGMRVPVVIGGAAINRPYGQRILFVEGSDGAAPYSPGVFYAKDAFEGLDIMDRLTDEDAQVRASFVTTAIDAAWAARAGQGNAPTGRAERVQRPAARIEPAAIPLPPFWGTRVLAGRDLALGQLFRYLGLRSLFRLQWGGKNLHGAEWVELLRQEFMPRLRAMQRDAIDTGWLQPRAVYGYFPCQSMDNDLIVYDPTDPAAGKQIARFVFPRQPTDERLSIADYFASVDSGRRDVVALQTVTMGEVASERVDLLQQAGDYSAAFYAHGLAVESAEALAEYVHRHVRAELGLAVNQGKRYSWGYPACPDLADHATVWQLLRPDSAIGVSLTDAYQLVPEQSTAAIIAHHAQARYFMVKAAEGDAQ